MLTAEGCLTQEMLEKMVKAGCATKETKNIPVWINMDSEPVQVIRLADVYTSTIAFPAKE